MNVDSLVISFSANVNCNGNMKNYYYEIDINKSFLSDPYCVISFYNLDIKENKKIFYPLDDKRDYTYEITSPSVSFVRERNK